MFRKSPELIPTAREKFGDLLGRTFVGGIMGAMALSAAGCGAPGLDAKPAPATVTVTAKEWPQAPQTVRVTETQTETVAPPPERSSRSTKPSQSMGEEVEIVSGSVTCKDGTEVVGIWKEVSNERVVKSGWVTTKPTDKTSTVTFEDVKMPSGQKIQLRVGCGGTKEDWGTVNKTDWMKPSVDGSHKLDVACYPEIGRCEVTER